MDSGPFYQVFDRLPSDESRLEFMSNLYSLGYNFNIRADPHAIIQRFYQGSGPAHKIVQMFVQCFGSIIVCREASSRLNKLNILTIVDTLAMELQGFQQLSGLDAQFNYMQARIDELLGTFIKVGMCSGSRYKQSLMRMLYNVGPYDKHAVQIDANLQRDLLAVEEKMYVLAFKF